MNPRRLIVRHGVLRDLAHHEHYLGAVRGAAFAEAWSEALLDWLENLAALGAQFGPAHPRHPGYRTFGYRRQATILAEFTDSAMDVVAFVSPERTGRSSPAVVGMFDATFAERAGPTARSILFRPSRRTRQRPLIP